jgi:hypothetical protein
MSLMTPDQQEVLKSTHRITINDYSYEIDSLDSLMNLQQEFMQSILQNSKSNTSTTPDINYKIEFIIDTKVNLAVSIFNREYIVDLLENINKFNQLTKLQKLNLS